MPNMNLMSPEDFASSAYAPPPQQPQQPVDILTNNPVQQSVTQPDSGQQQNKMLSPEEFTAQAYNIPVSEITPQQAQPKDESPSGFVSKLGALVQNFNTSMGALPNGIAQLLTQSAVGYGVPGAKAALSNLNYAVQQGNQLSAEEAKKYPVSSAVGQILGGIGQGIAMSALAPESMAATGLGKVASFAGLGAAQGGLNYADTFTERGQNALVGGLAGGALAAGSEIGGALLSKLGLNPFSEGANLFKKTINPERTTTQTLTGNIKTNPEAIQNAINMSEYAEKNMGIKMLPNQAFGDFYATAQRSVDPSDETIALFKQFNQEQQQQGLAAAKNLINRFVGADENALIAEKNAAYAKLKDLTVSDDTLNNLLQNKSISTRLKALNAHPDSQYASLPDNSLLKLNELKQNIGAEIHSGITTQNPTKASGSVTNNIPSGQFTSLNNAEDELVTALNAVAPNDYPAARRAAEKLILKQRYTNDLNRIVPKSTGSNVSAQLGEVSTPPTLNQVWTKLWGNDLKRNYFLKKVEETADNAAQVQDVKNQLSVLNAIRNNPMESFVSSTAKGEKAPGDIGAIVDFLKDIPEANYNDAIVRQSVNPSLFRENLKGLLQDPHHVINTLRMFKDAATSYPVTQGAVNAVRSIVSDGQNVPDENQ